MKKLAIIALALSLSNAALADNRSFDEYLVEENITTMNIKSKASIKTMPDMFRITVEYSTSDFKAKNAQLKLNKMIKEATAEIKKSKLEYSLNNFSSYQQHKSKKTTARQSITIDTPNKELLETVTTELQKQNGRVVNTRSYVSAKAQQEFFETLFNTAYDKANNKAKFMTSKLNANKFNVTKVDYYMNERQVRPMMARTMAMESDASAKMEMDNSNKELWLDMTMSIAILPNQK